MGDQPGYCLMSPRPVEDLFVIGVSSRMAVSLLLLLATVSVLLQAPAAFPSNLPLQFFLLGCQGTNNVRNLARLSRVCEDCYAMYKDHEIPVTCRASCFNNEIFNQCAQSISKQHLIEELLFLAQEIGLKPEEK